MYFSQQKESPTLSLSDVEFCAVKVFGKFCESMKGFARLYLRTNIQMIPMQGGRVQGAYTKPCWSQLLSKEHGSAFAACPNNLAALSSFPTQPLGCLA